MERTRFEKDLEASWLVIDNGHKHYVAPFLEGESQRTVYATFRSDFVMKASMIR